MKPFHAVFLLFVCLLATPLDAADLLLKNARLVDPAARRVVATDLLVREGKIVEPATSSTSTPPTVHDLQGRWVIPGLIDLHVHYPGNTLPNGGDEEHDIRESARIFLRAGVTAFLDLGSSTDEIFRERDRQRAGDPATTDEADIYCAGTPFGISGSPAAIARLQAYIAKWRPDVIKFLYIHSPRLPSPPPDALRNAAAAAHGAGVKTVVHISRWDDARVALAAGASAITHFHDEVVIPDDLSRAWAASATRSIPTLAVQTDLVNFVDHPELLDLPLPRLLAPASSRAAYRDRAHFIDETTSGLQWRREALANDRETFARLQRAGVRMLAGSDTNNLGVFLGYSLHRELLLMQENGYSPWEALAAGTTAAADFLGRPAGIHPGETAELVILDADPTVNIANTQKIHAVVHRGRYFPSALQQ